MTLPASGGQTYPPLTTSGTESGVVLAGRMFGAREEPSALRLGAVQTYLSLNTGGGGGTAVDDASNILANHVFGA